MIQFLIQTTYPEISQNQRTSLAQRYDETYFFKEKKKDIPSTDDLRPDPPQLKSIVHSLVLHKLWDLETNIHLMGDRVLRMHAILETTGLLPHRHNF